MDATTTPKESIMTRTEQIYTTLKMVDRVTPGRTPWQTLLRRAEQMAAEENLTEADRIN